jgi:REP element-mobilizing transposase RayT
MKDEVGWMREMPERRSICLPFYDYAASGTYFVTINTHKKLPVFGKLRSGEVELNRTGWIADGKWLQLPKHFPQVSLDGFIIMPTHMHGILFIVEEDPIAANRHVRAQHASPIQ